MLPYYIELHYVQQGQHVFIQETTRNRMETHVQTEELSQCHALKE